MNKILLIIPAYQEAANIERLVDNIIENYPQYDYLIVNDGSRDETVNICKRKGYCFADLPINLGIGGAVQTGYKYAQRNGYQIAIQIDGDGQHDISYVDNLVQPILAGQADITIGSRFIEKQGFQSTGLRRTGIKFLSNLIQICTWKRIQDVTSGFRAVNKKFINIYAQDYPRDYPEPEAIVSALMNKGKIQEIPVIMCERENGKSSIDTGKSFYYMIKVSLAVIVCRISFGIRR